VPGQDLLPRGIDAVIVAIEQAGRFAGLQGFDIVQERRRGQLCIPGKRNDKLTRCGGDGVSNGAGVSLGAARHDVNVGLLCVDMCDVRARTADDQQLPVRVNL
jgi:hypothetical protein